MRTVSMIRLNAGNDTNEKPRWPQLVATVVGIPQRGWRWGRRCEVRVHALGVEPRGRGYRDRCVEVHGDYDSRYRGPRSALGQLLARMRARGITT